MITSMPTPAQIAVIKREIGSVTAPILTRINALKIVDAASYAHADGLLFRINEARIALKSRFSEILDPLKQALTLAKQAHSKAKDMLDELDLPMANAEDRLRLSMREYKIEEQRQIQVAEQQRLAEQRRLEEEAEDKRRKARAAATPAMRTRLTNQAEQLEEKAQVTQAVPAAAPVKVAGSIARTYRKARVIDRKELLKAIISGQIPDDVIQIDESMLTRYLKMDEDTVKTWPGIEIFDDVVIARR